MTDVRDLDDLIEAFGGTSALAAKAGVLPSAVSNWRARRRIPAEHFFVLSQEAAAIGKVLDPGLFGFAEARP